VIKRIRLSNPTDAVLVDWAWRKSFPPDADLSAEHRGIASASPGYSRGTIVYLCSDTTGVAPNMAITVKTTGANGKFLGYWIDYDGGSAYVPFELDICELKTCPAGFEHE